MNQLTDKLWGAQLFHRDCKVSTIDTLITDFMKSHDEELLRAYNRCFITEDLWGIEKRREQAEWLKKEMHTSYPCRFAPCRTCSYVDKAFGLEPENLCDTCKDICKATHPRKECSLYIPKDPETQSPEPIGQLSHREDCKFKIFGYGECTCSETQSHKEQAEIADLKAKVEALEEAELSLMKLRGLAEVDDLKIRLRDMECVLDNVNKKVEGLENLEKMRWGKLRGWDNGSGGTK